MDIEIKNSNCSYDSNKRGAMIETIAVHPDYQRRGIAIALLVESVKLLEKMKIDYLECWTREDIASNGWYQKNGFKGFNEYYHVFTDKNIYSKDDNILHSLKKHKI
ncbi:GNAT family N-acetyltransferase [Macrococcus armenti]|nr:GNAT family N-acetyltransferase [Macrococcus armenti]UBH18840.1 GNAT family N-acetyltransferase [Macrococcus armenti]UBH21121.1 GNAT family N-acetyltransferase [Macrococcus armenti]